MATRLNLKAPAAGKHHHNFNPVTVTSLDFAEVAPTRVIETTLGYDLPQVKASGVMRMVPQTFPPYGKLFVKNATFFVPENQLIMYSDAFHSKKLTYQGKAVVMPYIRMVDVLSYIKAQSNNSVWCTVVDTGLNPFAAGFTDPDEDTFDFMFPYDDGGTVKFKTYRCGYKGAKLLKLLKLLGFDLPKYKVTNANLSATILSATFNQNALPLLAYLKIYCDMFMSGTFYNSSPLVSFLRAVKDGEDYSYNSNTLYTASTGHIDEGNVMPFIVEHVLTPHSSNMYTTAWNSLNSPDGLAPSADMSSLNPAELLSPFTPQFTNTPDQFGASASTVYMSNHASNPAKELTQQSLFMLHSVFQYVTRNNLAGTKPAQDLFARFGIKSEDFKSNFVHKISEGSQRIDFNAVMNNAGTPGSTLGDYAGFGASGIGVDYSYNASAFGYLITVHWLQIEPIVMRGSHPHTLRLDGWDYYTPEFDGKASRAIPYAEITSPKSVLGTTTGYKSTDVYGFTPLYQDYREMRDSVAGSFLSGKARRFLFARDFSKLGGSFHPQSNAVQYYSNDDNVDLTNPFNTVASAGDRFYLFLDWDISAETPVLNDEDTFNLDGKGDTVITKNGKMLS